MGDRLYRQGHRILQERFDSRALADRVAEVLVHDSITDEDRRFIEARDHFFLATVDDEGRPQCSYKGGDPGFVRVVDHETIAFPSYDGNGTFLSMGNLLMNPSVGMLFIDLENPRRLRLNGTASVRDDDPLIADYPEAQLVCRVTVREIFVNCPRYVHRYRKVESSPFVPRRGRETPVPEWKRRATVRDVLPERDRERICRDS